MFEGDIWQHFCLFGTKKNQVENNAHPSDENEIELFYWRLRGFFWGGVQNAAEYVSVMSFIKDSCCLSKDFYSVPKLFPYF